MKVLIDEHEGERTVVRLLREKGHEVKPINRSDLRGSSDPRLLEVAMEENRIIVTKDNGFFKDDTGKPKPIPYDGAIHLRGQYPIKRQDAERLAWTIDYICQKPELLNSLVELERPTPYGLWKLHPQGENTIVVEWLAYFIERIPISSYGEMISVPIES